MINNLIAHYYKLGDTIKQYETGEITEVQLCVDFYNFICNTIYIIQTAVSTSTQPSDEPVIIEKIPEGEI